MGKLSTVFNFLAVFTTVAFSQLNCAKRPFYLKSYLVHPEDCSIYYICFNGRAFLMKCNDDEVFDTESTSCVQRGSEMDTCSSNVEKESLRCSAYDTGSFSHTESCAKYFDCSDTSRGKPRTRECPYPYLFDTMTKSCRYFTEVTCGDRPEPKNPCDYEMKPCNDNDCSSCHSNYPSCVDFPDGLNPWRGREWTSHFILCSGERVLFHGVCSESQVFHPDKLKCVESDIHNVS